MRRRGWTIAAAILMASATTAVADERSELRFQRGLAHYKVQNYEAAITEFRVAYAIDPQPKVLFNWAQAERLSGDCASAVELYRRLAAQEIPEGYAKIVRDNLRLCETILAEEAEDQEEPLPTPADTTSTSPVSTTHVSPTLTARPIALRPAWYTDPVGGVLVASGVTAMSVSLFFYVRSVDRLNDARGAATFPDYNRYLDDARSDRLVSQVVLGVGAAAVLGGVLRYMLHDPAPRVPAAGIVMGEGTTLFSIQGEF